MPLPVSRYIELPLLYEIERAGGTVRPNQELFDKVASHFPELTEEDRRIATSSGVNWWNNRISWVRTLLCDKGELDRSERGVWRITDGGRERLRREWQQWPPGGEGTGPPQPPPPPTPSVSTLADFLQAINDTATLRTRLKDRIAALSDTDFEYLAAKYMERVHGLQNVHVTRATGDRNVDVYGDRPIVPFPRRVAAQAKKWLGTPVGRPAIQAFRGAIQGEFSEGIFITSSRFTPEAEEEARRPGAVLILLVNGDKLLDDLIQHRVGIREHTVEIKITLPTTQIDEEFFQGVRNT